MNRRKRCNQIIEQYYDEIVRYCIYLLKDDFRGAEDCAHDTFLLLLRKQNELDFDRNIRGWLYASTDRIVKDYRRKQLRMQAMLNYDTANIEDSAFDAETLLQSETFDCLNDEELDLLKAYYAAQKGERIFLAKQYGLTISELYKKVHAIRQKLRDHLK